MFFSRRVCSFLAFVVAFLLVAPVAPASPAHKRSTKSERRLERWLARQVGPKKPRSCVRMRRCRGNRAIVAKSFGKDGAAVIPAAAVKDPLQLVRSYDIPTSDPSYDRLLNWSWTYDSAIAATAFAASGQDAQAERLLDQLGALQHRNGSIETAFDVYTGETSGQMRSGTIGWTGLAAATYDLTRPGSRYASIATDAADWMLTQRDLNPSSPTFGLVRGGPDVSWYSTQHNIVAYFLFERLAWGPDGGSKAKAYRDAAEAIARGIESRLIVRSGSDVWFRQGYGDDVRPLDTQTLGGLFLISRLNRSEASRVQSYMDSHFQAWNRSIVKSTTAATFNNSYAATGPFVGYFPYADAGGPDVLWAEGTAQARLLRTALGMSTSFLDGHTKAWDKVTSGTGPLQADRTVTGSAWNEYHVWPTAAAGAWRILSGQPADYFVLTTAR